MKTYFLIVQIITIIGMVVAPLALLSMQKEKTRAMERANSEIEAIAISKGYNKKFIKNFLIFVIPALILNIISAFY